MHEQPNQEDATPVDSQAASQRMAEALDPHGLAASRAAEAGEPSPRVTVRLETSFPKPDGPPAGQAVSDEFSTTASDPDMTREERLTHARRQVADRAAGGSELWRALNPDKDQQE
jgi:hypothetical protein